MIVNNKVGISKDVIDKVKQKVDLMGGPIERENLNTIISYLKVIESGNLYDNEQA